MIESSVANGLPRGFAIGNLSLRSIITQRSRSISTRPSISTVVWPPRHCHEIASREST